MNKPILLTILLASLCCFTPPPMIAAEGQASAAKDDTLSNASIIQMHKLGLGETVLIEKIKASRCSFNTSIEGLKQLKDAGLTDNVISTMISSSAATPAAASGSNQPPPADVNDPASPHEPGIWWYTETGGKKKMTKLEPSVISKMETGSGWGAGFGRSMKMRANLAGGHAALQIGDNRPTFYFYFEVTQSGLSQSGWAATSPNEFVLARMEVEEKDKRRRLIVGRINAYSGSQMGTDDKQVCPITFEKLGPGSYKVTPQKDLALGEYAFFYAGATPIIGFGVMGGGGKLFDFGVSGGK